MPSCKSHSCPQTLCWHPSSALKDSESSQAQLSSELGFTGPCSPIPFLPDSWLSASEIQVNLKIDVYRTRCCSNTAPQRSEYFGCSDREQGKWEVGIVPNVLRQPMGAPAMTRGDFEGRGPGLSSASTAHSQ